MNKHSSNPKSLSEAIEHIESQKKTPSDDWQETLEKNFEDLKSKVENLKPFLDDMAKTVGKEAVEGKNKVEAKVKENPWIALGIVGLVAFIIGWLMGSRRND